MSNKVTKTNKNIKEQPQISVSIKKSFKTVVYAIICFLLAFILYSNTFKHSYVLDDGSVIADNSVVKEGIHGIPIILKTSYRYGANILWDNLYRPISLIMFAIEWQISPNNPHLSHFINVLFYALSCFFLFIVLRKYMSKVHALIPFFITLLYAAHPIHAEVVANIKSRDEIMSFFFLMLTFLCLHIWFTKKKWWSLIVSLLIFFLAVLSKEGVISMLLLFPIIGWYFTEAKPKAILTSSLLLILPALTYLIIRHQIISKYSVSSTIMIIDNILVGAPDLFTHFATAVMLLGKYLLLLIIPYQLVCDYSYNQIPIVGLIDPKFILSFLIYITVCIYGILNFRKKSPVVFGFLFFLISISTYSNILFNIGTSFGERLMFIPSLGLYIAIVFLISQWLKIGINDNIKLGIDVLKVKPVFTTICIIILLVFSVKTVVRAAEWENETILYGNDVKYSPNSAHMHLYWGSVILNDAKQEEDSLKKNNLLHQAISQFEKCLSIYPDYMACYEKLSLAWLELGDLKKTLYYYNIVLKIYPQKAENWYSVGLLYYQLGNYQKALEVYNKAINLKPYYSDAYYNRGLAKKQIKYYQGAIADYNIAIAINPNYSLVYCDRGLAKYNIKDYAGAIADFTKAIEIDPKYSNAYINKGCTLAKLKKYEESIVEFKKCIQFDPENIAALKYIGLSYQNLKQFTEAKLWFEKASILEQKQKIKT